MTTASINLCEKKERKKEKDKEHMALISEKGIEKLPQKIRGKNVRISSTGNLNTYTFS